MDKYECACKSGFTLGKNGKSCNKGLILKLAKYFVHLYALGFCDSTYTLFLF